MTGPGESSIEKGQLNRENQESRDQPEENLNQQSSAEHTSRQPRDTAVPLAQPSAANLPPSPVTQNIRSRMQRHPLHHLITDSTSAILSIEDPSPREQQEEVLRISTRGFQVSLYARDARESLAQGVFIGLRYDAGQRRPRSAVDDETGPSGRAKRQKVERPPGNDDGALGHNGANQTLPNPSGPLPHQVQHAHTDRARDGGAAPLQVNTGGPGSIYQPQPTCPATSTATSVDDSVTRNQAARFRNFAPGQSFSQRNAPATLSPAAGAQASFATKNLSSNTALHLQIESQSETSERATFHEPNRPTQAPASPGTLNPDREDLDQAAKSAGLQDSRMADTLLRSLDPSHPQTGPAVSEHEHSMEAFVQAQQLSGQQLQEQISYDDRYERPELRDPFTSGNYTHQTTANDANRLSPGANTAHQSSARPAVQNPKKSSRAGPYTSEACDPAPDKKLAAERSGIHESNRLGTRTRSGRSASAAPTALPPASVQRARRSVATRSTPARGARPSHPPPPSLQDPRENPARNGAQRSHVDHAIIKDKGQKSRGARRNSQAMRAASPGPPDSDQSEPEKKEENGTMANNTTRHRTSTFMPINALSESTSHDVTQTTGSDEDGDNITVSTAKSRGAREQREHNEMYE